MADSEQAPERARNAKPQLDYPFDRKPERGQTLVVAPGVRWIRMPMPMALDHINLWAIDDGDGWAVVDTGLRTDDTAKAWRELWAATNDPRPMSRIFVTHMHPDHIGMAGWLAGKFKCRMWITREEYMGCRVMASYTGREAPQAGVDFYRGLGWGEDALETYRTRFGNFGKYMYSLPDTFRRMRDGEVIRIGAHDWRVVVGRGHSPEHACLYCPDLKLFISGDQVLPRISSNVSVYPHEPEADPMGEWYESMAKIRREVPDDVLVLPAHNDPFRGLHARIDYLMQSQDRAMQRLRRALREPKRAIDVFGALFARPISEADTDLLSMATGEAMACLNNLERRGQVQWALGDDGVRRYSLVAGVAVPDDTEETGPLDVTAAPSLT
jgi:glyoxylase-like metal-dependent hydrolase (beta-lactamase superfamily II)